MWYREDLLYIYLSLNRTGGDGGCLEMAELVGTLWLKMLATSFSSELCFLLWKTLSASSAMLDSKGNAWKGRGLRLLVIFEEVEVVKVAMVYRPLSIDVSPKFCKIKQVYFLLYYKRLLYTLFFLVCMQDCAVRERERNQMYTNLRNFPICLFIIGHERVP